MINEITHGDALTAARAIGDNSVNCIVTSPPYYGLRDYGDDGQLGLEETPELYIAKMVEIFRELRRVLRDDGTCWLNLGDSYADKNLIGIPWRVALALQADGWYLRSEIIWHKPSPMPESVTDRPTKSHEQLFLLSKSARYWYDADAVREDFADERMGNPGKYTPFYKSGSGRNDGNQIGVNGEWDGSSTLGRNLRSVWTIATKPYKEAHFAVFPPALIEKPILAGCPARVCVECGTPWVREVEKSEGDWEKRKENGATSNNTFVNGNNVIHGDGVSHTLGIRSIRTIGHAPQCNCNAPHRPGVVYDPFMGSGTTAAVAVSLGRSYSGSELNPDYIELAKRRIAAAQPALFPRE